jgi:hypothetical protein
MNGITPEEYRERAQDKPTPVKLKRHRAPFGSLTGQDAEDRALSFIVAAGGMLEPHILAQRMGISSAAMTYVSRRMKAKGMIRMNNQFRQKKYYEVCDGRAE